MTPLCNTSLDTSFPSAPPGRVHVRARRGGQPVGEPENGLPVQGVAGGAQPPGAHLGEASEGLPSPAPALHPPAAQAGTHTLPHPAPQVDLV